MQSNKVKPAPMAEVQSLELDESESAAPLTVVIIEDGQSQTAGLRRVGLPPDARSVVYITPQDALL